MVDAAGAAADMDMADMAAGEAAGSETVSETVEVPAVHPATDSAMASVTGLAGPEMDAVDLAVMDKASVTGLAD